MLTIHPGIRTNAHTGGSSIYTWNAVGEGMDFFFHAETDDPIVAVGLPFYGKTGTPGTFRVSVQGMDWANMKGDGVEVVGVDVAASTIPTGLGIREISIPATALTKGQPYAIVFRAASGTWDASNYLQSRPVLPGGMDFSQFPGVSVVYDGLTQFSLANSGLSCFYYKTADAIYGRPVYHSSGAGWGGIGNYYDLSGSSLAGMTGTLHHGIATVLTNHPSADSLLSLKLYTDFFGVQNLVAESSAVHPISHNNNQRWNHGYNCRFLFLDQPTISFDEPFFVEFAATASLGTAYNSWVCMDSSHWQAYGEDFVIQAYDKTPPTLRGGGTYRMALDLVFSEISGGNSGPGVQVYSPHLVPRIQI